MPETIDGGCHQYTRSNPGNTAEYYEYTVGSETSITAELWGAEGFGVGVVGGKGAYLKVSIPVTPGEVLRVYVGGKPPGDGAGYPDGGVNGSTGGGGGSSSIWRKSDNTPLAIAGAGGSYGEGNPDGATLGNAGVPGTNGTDGGWNGQPDPSFAHRRGRGATTGSPGAGGTFNSGGPADTVDGDAGSTAAWDAGAGGPARTGGAGGTDVGAWEGGNGGGGWHGGGGGAGGFGGGGGGTHGAGGGGGGMSGVASGVTITASTAATRSGHGEVRICGARGHWRVGSVGFG